MFLCMRFFIFFFKQKTAYEMRISDWSSDVCSSDLRRFVIEGVESLNGAEARLAGDRLEAFSYMAAGLMTGGQVRVGGCHQDRLVTAINTLHRMGAHVDINDTRSETRRVGQECVRTCRYRWNPCH